MLSNILDVDCEWEDWMDWSLCSQTCGGGVKTRSRKIAVGGNKCTAETNEEIECGTDPCGKF